MPAYTTPETPQSPASASAAAEPAQDERDVVDRYLDRVRGELEAMPPHERLPFLCQQRTQWLIGYARFERRMEQGKQPDKGETAATYVLGIAELGKLKGAEEARCAIIPTESNHA